jgi:hypothetical protein
MRAQSHKRSRDVSCESEGPRRLHAARDDTQFHFIQCDLSYPAPSLGV